MLQNILKLNGVQELDKKQQSSVSGGRLKCTDDYTGECIDFGLQCAERVCILLGLA